MKFNLILTFLLLITRNLFSQNNFQDSFLFKIENNKTGEFCYVNKTRDTIIPFGKYEYCYTDTLEYFAIVKTFKTGKLYAINRHGIIMYQVYPYDTGPDIPFDSLFRIIINNKIGFAHQRTGEIIIPPKYRCASSFVNETAMVSIHCKCKKSSRSEDKFWIYINKSGNQIDKPSGSLFIDYSF